MEAAIALSLTDSCGVVGNRIEYDYDYGVLELVVTGDRGVRC